MGLGFLIELCYLDGRKLIGGKYDMYSLIQMQTTNG